MYWVVDEPNATYKVLQSVNDSTTWARDHRNTAQLAEFVHLMFTGDAFDGFGSKALGYTIEHTTRGVVANGRGCFVFPNQISAYATATYFLDALANVAAHELTHAIIDTRGSNGFDRGEHVEDPNPADWPGGPLDDTYLMFAGSTNLRTIVFDDKTRGQIDLSRKESVEL